MTNAMKKSPLWQRTFAESNDHNVTRLVTSLRGARDRDIVKSCGSAISVIRRLPSDPPRCLVPAALRR